MISPGKPREKRPRQHLAAFRGSPDSTTPARVPLRLPHPTPCTLHPAPCTLHPAPCTPPPTPYTLLRNEASTASRGISWMTRLNDTCSSNHFRLE